MGNIFLDLVLYYGQAAALSISAGVGSYSIAQKIWPKRNKDQPVRSEDSDFSEKDPSRETGFDEFQSQFVIELTEKTYDQKFAFFEYPEQITVAHHDVVEIPPNTVHTVFSFDDVDLEWPVQEKTGTPEQGYESEDNPPATDDFLF